MKKWLALTLGILLTLAACGCAGASSGPAAESAPPQAPPASESGSSAPEAQTVQAVDVKAAGGPLTETEILNAYARAVEAYSWFDLCTPPTDGPGIQADGSLYYRVKEDGFATLEDLHIYLRGLFAQEIVARLLPEDGRRFRDIDGVLCVMPGARGADIYKGAVTTSVAEDGDGYLVNVTVETLEEDLQTVSGVECSSFPYRYVNGRWVFTEFSLVY